MIRLPHPGSSTRLEVLIFARVTCGAPIHVGVLKRRVVGLRPCRILRGALRADLHEVGASSRVGLVGRHEGRDRLVEGRLTHFYFLF